MVVAMDQGQKEKWGGSNAAEELGILVFQDKKKMFWRLAAEQRVCTYPY